LARSAVTAPFVAAERAKAEAGQGRALPKDTDYARILDDIRRTRLSRVEGTLLPGLNAMAAPVFDYRGKLSSVIGLVGHRESLDMDGAGPIAQLLKSTAAELSARLGFVEARAGGGA
jgi:DNA-binding IclR family transcriptional regulator